MKNIYLIRHGEGYHNLLNKDLDNWHIKYPRLTTNGIYQCLEVKKNFLNLNILLLTYLDETTIIYDRL